MIDTEEYIEMWKDNLLSTEGVVALIKKLIGDRWVLRGDMRRVLNRIDLSDYDEYPDIREIMKSMMLKYDIEYMGEENIEYMGEEND